MAARGRGSSRRRRDAPADAFIEALRRADGESVGSHGERLRDALAPLIAAAYDNADVAARRSRRARGAAHNADAPVRRRRRPHARAAQLDRRPRRSPVDRRGLARDLHRAFGEGPRMGRRAPAQRRRRQLPVRHGAHLERRARRRAPALLRRGDPPAPPPPRVRPAALPLPAARSRRRAHAWASRADSSPTTSPPASTPTHVSRYDARPAATIDAGIRVEMELDALWK